MSNANFEKSSDVSSSKLRFMTPLAMLIALGLIASCSDSSFTSTGSNAKNADVNRNGDALPGGADGGNGTDGTEGKDGTNGNTNDAAINNSATNPGGNVNVEVANDGTVTEKFRGSLTEKSTAVDIIFAMDTSGSMNSEKTRLQTNMATFMTQFREKAKAIDFKVIMIGNNFQFPAADDKISLVNTTVNSNDALTVLKNYVSGAGVTALRANTNKHIIVVTDDNAKVTTSSVFQTFISGNALLKDKTFAHGLIGLKNGAPAGNNWCNIAAVGSEYQSLAAATKGTILDLCQEDWTLLMNQLATAIITKEAKREFVLTHKPADASSLKVLVNGTELPTTAWQYDAAKNTLTIVEASAPKEADQLVVIYKK